MVKELLKLVNIWPSSCWNKKGALFMAHCVYCGPYKVLCPQIFTRTRDWPRLASTHPKGTRVPQKFWSWTFKIWLNVQSVGAYNFRASGCIFTKLFQATCCKAGDPGVITWVHVQCLPLKFGRAKKRPKIGAISNNFWLSLRISLERIAVSKIRKVLDQLQPLPRWMKKISGDYISAFR